MKKKLLVILSAVLICVSLAIPSFALTLGINNTPIPDEHTRLVDMADLIDDSEEAELLSELDKVSERHKFDVVFVTTDDLQGKTAREYADDFFDYNGYGIGKDRDGVLFLGYYEDEGNKEIYISTRGFGIKVFTDAGIECIYDELEEYAANGDCYSLAEKYAELSDEFITKAEKKLVGKWIFTSLIVGIILALIVTLSMKSKLKTVRSQVNASDYTRPDSLRLINSRDTYLYRQVSRKAKPKNTGGSSTHTSSSGATHGGGGRSV